MIPFDFQPRTRIVFGPDKIESLGELAGELGARRALVVTDPGIVAAGHVERGIAALEAGRHRDAVCSTASARTRRPSTSMPAWPSPAATSPSCSSAWAAAARWTAPRGSIFSTPTAAGCRTTGASARPRKPMLPMIAVPTTAGTGSETQSFALISDAETHVKMACGDKKASFRVAMLDPDAHRVAAAARDGADRHRRHRPRAWKPTSRSARNAAVAGVQPRGVAAVGREFRPRARRPERPGSPLRRCNWAPASPGWRSRTRCSARRMPWPIR